MTLEFLQKEMITAMKAKDKFRKETISGLVGAVKKAAIDARCRDNITETLVDTTLLKEQKTIQEMIDTCPASRPEILASYIEKKKIIDEFAPQLITDPVKVEEFIDSLGIEVSKANRGALMKALKGKVDMKIANAIISKRI